MTQPLELLLADGVIDEVLGRLKTGKEAEVWLVLHAGQVLAAKVYKERHHRAFRHNAAYREGRQVRNSRTQRAIERGSRFGKTAAEDAWKSTEADALEKLHQLGVRVPRPALFYEGVLLMELVVDPQGQPAPRLIDAPIAPEQARAMYELLRGEVLKMLCADIIHGDLSPFNILLAWDGPVIIDFPQLIGAAHNNRAEGFFKRDLDNVRDFFTRFDPGIRAIAGDGDEIWRAYVRRELTPDFVPTGRPPRAESRPGPRDSGGRPSGPGQGAGFRGQGSRPPREDVARRGGQRRGGLSPEVSYRGAPPGGGQPAGQQLQGPRSPGAWDDRRQQGRGPEQQGRGAQPPGRGPPQQGGRSQQQAQPGGPPGQSGPTSSAGTARQGTPNAAAPNLPVGQGALPAGPGAPAGSNGAEGRRRRRRRRRH